MRLSKKICIKLLVLGVIIVGAGTELRTLQAAPPCPSCTACVMGCESRRNLCLMKKEGAAVCAAQYNTCVSSCPRFFPPPF